MLLIQKRVPNIRITSNIALKPLTAFAAVAASIQVVQNIEQKDVLVKERRRLPRNTKTTSYSFEEQRVCYPPPVGGV
jgi:hypothetical protein